MYKVLLADDERYVRELLKRLAPWEELGFVVDAEAQDGEEAIALAERAAADVVFADIEMPFVNGLELAEHLHAHHPELLIVFLTGYDYFEYAQAAMRFGVQEYLLKPVVREELVQVLRRLRAKLDKRHQLEDSLRAGAGAALLVREELAAVLRRRDSEEIATYIHDRLGRMGRPGMRESREAVLGMMMDTLESHCYEAGLPLEGAGAGHSDEAIVQLFVKTVCGGEDRQVRHNRLIETVKEHIAANYRDPDLSLATIAESIYVNPSYLSRLFTQVTGESISGHIRELRLAHAMGMLKSGVSSIELIAYNIGFRNAGYFSKCFKERYGMAPSEFAGLGDP